jgi:hypothetical protein
MWQYIFRTYRKFHTLKDVYQFSQIWWIIILVKRVKVKKQMTDKERD